jgi:hypothetical protein
MQYAAVLLVVVFLARRLTQASDFMAREFVRISPRCFRTSTRKNPGPGP